MIRVLDDDGTEMIPCECCFGRRLNAEGGMQAMRDAYYEAKGRNPHIHVIQAYWDGIGDWVW